MTTRFKCSTNELRTWGPTSRRGLRTSRQRESLLDRLRVEIRDVRPRVLSEPSLERLDELRRFRRFKRYYYRIDHDPDKLAFLVKKTSELQLR